MSLTENTTGLSAILTEINNLPDRSDLMKKPGSFAENNLVIFDESGNAKDSGKSVDDVAAGQFLPLSGGTVTGDLTIQKSSPQLSIVNTENGYNFYLRMNNDNTGGFYCLKDDNNRVGMFFNSYTTDVAKSVRISRKYNGQTAYYSIYGEHNKPTAADVKARPSTWLPTTEEIGALSLTGGTLTGEIDLNGQAFYGEFNKPTAADVGALSLTGGTLTGEIDLNGQAFYGEFNKPTAADVGALSLTGGTITGNLAVNGTLGASALSNQLKGLTHELSGAYTQNTDLNTYITPGRYGVGSSSWATTTLNFPVNGIGGHLEVDGGSNAITQIYIGYSGSSNYVRIFVRHYYKTNDFWSEWDELYSTYKKPTAADVGALPLSGGTITGNLTVNGTVTGTTVKGAVWNDYAEFRSQAEEVPAGYCVMSNDDGQVSKTTERLQACDGITSDTYGFSIGETDECKTPLAVAGRVLAYCEGDRNDYHAGDTVCAAAGGLVSKMSREEIREYPDRIVGIVSEIPTYENWGEGNVEVNNRIWIKVR